MSIDHFQDVTALIDNANTLADVAQKNPEILFFSEAKCTGSDIRVFESYLDRDDNKKRFLGFDGNGNPKSPTKVDRAQAEAHFLVVKNVCYPED